MDHSLQFSLTFNGASSDKHLIEMYDGAKALAGFQRSLAITTHLVLNNELITQAPSLKGATIYMPVAEEGSWKTLAIIAIGTTLTAAGTASKDSLYGHLVASGYAYVTNAALGFSGNYETPLQEQIEAYNSVHDKKLDISRFDGAIEKAENSIIDMHRPIVKSETAYTGKVKQENEEEDLAPKFPILNIETHNYINYTRLDDRPITLQAKIPSYNINTFRGRAYLPDLGNRTIPLTLLDTAKNATNVWKITDSLSRTANTNDGFVFLTFFRNESSTGRLKSIRVLSVMSVDEYERSQKHLN